VAPVHRLLLALILLAAAVLAGAGGSPAGGAAPSGSQVYSHMKAVIDEETQATHLVGGSIEDTLKAACLEVVNHPDADEASEARRLLADAGRDLNETIDKDVRPAVNGSGSDYAAIARQLEALAHASTGLRHQELLEASLKLRLARLARLDAIGYYRRAITARLAPKLACLEQDIVQAGFVRAQNAEQREQDALGAARVALKAKPTHIRGPQPQRYRIVVTLTAIVAESMTMPTDTACGEPFNEQGTLTETATFGPVTVSPKGTVATQLALTAEPTYSGTWTAGGTYYSEEQCDHPTPFSCGGGFHAAVDVQHTAELDVAGGKGGLTLGQVHLPDVGEDDQSCPDGGDAMTFIGVPTGEINALARHAQDLDFTFDGVALRQHFQPLTIEDVVHQGPALPAIDCTDVETLAATCTTAGSRVHDTVRIEPIEDAG
jgi:hypothetical protein